MDLRPSYLALLEKGELSQRTEMLYSLMENCTLCGRKCLAKRKKGETGECGADDRLYISSAFAHLGEEPPITGLNGSGTIFLTHCNLHCIFCQNFDISHKGEGQEVTTGQLAEVMLSLQQQKVHNINFVTPTHYAPMIVVAVGQAADQGLTLPLVWNCGGYESTEVLRLLDGIVDIYMPDLKFLNEESAEKFLNAPDYPEVAKEAIKEMNKQVGPLKTDGYGVATRGLLVRHLVMPGHSRDTDAVLEFIAGELGEDTYVNVMDQYRPMYMADRFKEINRQPSDPEISHAYEKAGELGLTSGLL